MIGIAIDDTSLATQNVTALNTGTEFFFGISLGDNVCDGVQC